MEFDNTYRIQWINLTIKGLDFAKFHDSPKKVPIAFSDMVCYFENNFQPQL
jgi:hypothetical protein